VNLRRAVLSDPARRRDLAAIHVGKKQLAMDDDTYRAMLWSIARVRSAGDLDFAGRKQVLEHLRKCGFSGTQKRGAQDALSRKIRALWLRLRDLDELRDASEEALEHYVERVTGAKALQWLSSDQARVAIESLKQWERRVLHARKASS
jgi:phage gp16-like protein